MAPPFPIFRPVGANGVLVELGDKISDAAAAAVTDLETALRRQPFEGFAETVPGYVNLLVLFDPLATDHGTVETTLRALLTQPGQPRHDGRRRDVEICYDPDLAPDIARVAAATGLTPDSVAAAHLNGDFRVVMYGFAPGYAYMSGVPQALQLPRKPAAVRGIPKGSVLIAGPQCIVTTLTMPTGWWIIGRSPTEILTADPSRPFLLDVGDTVQFRRIDRATFEAKNRG
jgi:inhibitor of KinA